MKTMAGTVIMTAVLLALPAAASAQEDRWAPWLGCWTLVDENTHEGAGAARAALLSPIEPRLADPENEPRACVARAGDGVTITTTVPNQMPTVQTLIADGSGRPITDDECRGTEHTSWSTNGQLLFARADVTCADDASPRTITGLGMITAQGQWLDVRTFRIDGRNTTRVSRYQRADGPPVPGHHLTIEEITEASHAVSPLAVEAAIAETRPPLTVKSKQLLELSDAQVPPSVIDVMVAVAYPRQFVVERSQGGGGSGRAYGAYGLYDPFFDLGYWPSYYYSPFAYGYIGRYNPIAFPSYGGSIGDGSGGVPPRGTGRAINGEGYTRVKPNTPDRPAFVSRSGSESSSSSGSVSSRSSSSSDGGSSSSTSNSSSGGSGGASPQGYSSGGSEGGGRTAQPR